MDAERARAFLLALPYVVETMQWDALVFWVGDKTLVGKMFTVIGLDEEKRGVTGKAVISYAAGRERYDELLEIEGLFPAPYLARAHWIAAERWDVFRTRQWEQELAAAHAIVLAKLPPKAKKALE